MKRTSRRALVEHLLRRHELVLTRAVSSHDRFAVLKRLERAEKRFLVAFLTSLVGSSFILAWRLWGLTLSQLAALPLSDLLTIAFAVIMIASNVSAVLSYLSVGLVVQRAVEIRPREED